MALLLSFLLLPAQAAPDPVPFPGGVLDSTERTAYVGSTDGIRAVDLSNGDILWQTTEAQVPLLVVADRLYALGLVKGNRLEVLAYNLAGKGERVFRTVVDEFPRWVSTASDDFHLTWRRVKTQMYLEWRASSTPELGGPAKHAAGQVKIDLERGRVVALPGTLAAPARETNLYPPQLEKQAIRFSRYVGQQLLAVVAEDISTRPGDREQRLVFRAWDRRTGKATASREVLHAKQPIVLLDLDGRRLWIRDASLTSDPASSSRWVVVSVVDGTAVARVPYVPGTKVATLIGQRAYCLTMAPRRVALDGPPGKTVTLHAIDLESGKLLWSRPIGTPISALDS